MILGAWMRFAEGVALLCLGLFAFGLSFSEYYSMYLNPRYAWLTATAGCLLMIFGVLRLSSRESRGAPVRLLALSVMVAMAGMSDASFQPNRGPIYGQTKKKESPTLAYNGTDYTKINPAELFYLVKESKFSKISGPFVARGIARHKPELAAENRFYLVRLNMVCCAADAVGLGLIVQLPQGRPLPLEGAWVRVFGSLRPYKKDGKLKAAPPPEGKITSLISEKAFMEASLAEPTDRPASPYVFALGAEPPYQY